MRKLESSESQLDLSFNNLLGSVPFSLIGAFDQRIFKGNPNLCVPGLPQAKTCSSRKEAWRQRYWITSAVITIGDTFFSIFCYLCKTKQFFDCSKQDANPLDEAEWSLVTFMNLDFTLDEVLSSLNETNVIGSGGSGQVYHARLKNGGSLAVKKLWASTESELDNYSGLRSEVETLGKIRHSNIVKLLCHCFNKEASLLVYEYMPNGSLGNWLHGYVEAQPLLDWRICFKIALGTAQGLAYLHHDCLPPVVHRDVKCNNILLDADFKAHIVDFGLAMALSNSSEVHTLTGITGSFGYIAPETGYAGKVTEKCDVYSCGMVLLELVTEKCPIELEFGSGVDIPRWVRGNIIANSKAGLSASSSPSALLDPKIAVVENEKEMLLILKMGVECTSALPMHRPSMQDVVELLQETARRFSNNL